MTSKKKRKSKLKIFALCCGCFLLFLVVAYIFRERLFSTMICQQITAAIKENTGIEVNIEKFSGSYFSDIELHNMRLVDGNGIVSELQFDKVSVSYNLFALISGEKIVENVVLKNLRVVVIKNPPSAAAKTKETDKPVDIDLDFILKQVPDIDINNVYLEYNVGGQKLQISGLDFTNRNNNSHIKIKKILAQNKDVAEQISAIEINSNVDNKVFSIKNLHVHIDRYNQDLNIPNIFSIDLNHLQQLPVSFSLPTPGGVIDGTIAIASGKNIKIGNGEVDFNKTIDLVSLLQGKNMKNTAGGKLGFKAQFDLPDWDVNALNGITQIDIFNEKRRKWKGQTPEKEGLKTLFYIEDFAILENIAGSFIELQQLKSEGKIALANVLKIKDELVSVNGRIHEGDIKTKFFSQQTIEGSWKASYDTQKSVVDVSAVKFRLGDIKSTIKSYLDLKQSKKSFIDANFSAVSIGQYANLLLPKTQQNAYNGDISIAIKGGGVLPSNVDSLDKFDGVIECQLNNMVVDFHKLGNIKLSIKFSVEKNSIHIKKFISIWNGKKIFDLSGKSGWKQLDDFRLSGRYRLTNIAKKLQQFVPQLQKKFNANIDGKFEVFGKIPQGDNLNITLRQNLKLQKVSVDGKLNFDDITIPLVVKLTKEAIKISKFKVNIDKENWVDVHGNVQLQRDKKSVVHFNVNIPEPLAQVAKIVPQSFPGQVKRIVFRNKIWGKLLAIDGQESLYVKSHLELQDGKVEQLDFKKIVVEILSKGNFQSLFVRSFGVNVDDEIRLAITPFHAHFSEKILLNTKGKLFAKSSAIQKIVPKLQTTDINSDFSLYLHWKSLEILAAKSRENNRQTLEYLLTQPKKDIWQHAKKNLNINFSFRAKTSKIQIDKFVHRNADIRINSKFEKGKYNNQVQVSIDKKKLLNFFAKGNDENIHVESKIRLNNAQKYLVQFAPQFANINANIIADLSLKTPIPKNLEAIPPLDVKCKVAFDKGHVNNRFTFDKIEFVSSISTNSRTVNIDSYLHLDNKQLLKTAGFVTLQQPYAGKMTTDLNIDRLEKYADLVNDQRLISGRLAIKNVFDFTLQKDILQSNIQAKTTVQLSNGSVIQKPYESISLTKNVHLQNHIVDLQELKFSFDQQDLCNVSGKWDLQQKQLQNGKLSSEIDLQRICSKFIPSEDIGGHSSLKLNVNGHLQNLRCALDFSLRDGRYNKHQLSPVTFSSQYTIQKDLFTLTKANLRYAQKPILELSGSTGYVENSSFQVKLVSNIGEAINDMASFIGQKPPIFNGESKIEVECRGKIPSQSSPLDLGIDIKVPFSNKPDLTFWQINLGEISLWGNKKKAPHGLGCLIKISGDSKRPVVKALFNFKQELIRIPQANTRINDIVIDGTIANQKCSLQLRCLVGGGSIESTTTVLFNEQYFPTKVDFGVVGKRILLVRNEMLYGRADLDIHLRGDVIKTASGSPKFIGELGGVIDITEFKVTADMTIDAVLQPAPERAATSSQLGIDSPFLDLALNLHIKVSQVSVFSSLARIKMRGDLYVKGRAASPKISGGIRTTLGKLFLPQGNMDIRQCFVSFSANRPLVPQINIIAETQIRSYLVSVNITGSPGDMSIEFSSSPALPKEDVLTLLLTGATRSELQQSGGGQQLEDLGTSVLLQQILSTLGIGGFVSAQVTAETTTVTVAPESWRGIGIQGKTEQTDTTNTSALNFLYRIQFK